MSEYLTQQRRILLDLLENNPDKQLSAKQIAEEINNSISISAVYRNLSYLESEGIISRIAREGSRESYYQYTDADKCRDKLHLTCTKCGSVFHMNKASADEMIKDVSVQDGFSIDTKKTIVYGICNKCR